MDDPLSLFREMILVCRHANELAQSEGLTLNHFISIAVAEKIVRMESCSSRSEDLNVLASSPSAVEWRHSIKQ